MDSGMPARFQTSKMLLGQSDTAFKASWWREAISLLGSIIGAGKHYSSLRR